MDTQEALVTAVLSRSAAVDMMSTEILSVFEPSDEYLTELMDVWAMMLILAIFLVIAM